VREIDTIVLNAGIYPSSSSETVDKLPDTFQVNFLSQWLLLYMLRDIMAQNSKVVFVGSSLYKRGGMLLAIVKIFCSLKPFRCHWT
jgi:hypothetical protein